MKIISMAIVSLLIIGGETTFAANTLSYTIKNTGDVQITIQDPVNTKSRVPLNPGQTSLPLKAPTVNIIQGKK